MQQSEKMRGEQTTPYYLYHHHHPDDPASHWHSLRPERAHTDKGPQVILLRIEVFDPLVGNVHFLLHFLVHTPHLGILHKQVAIRSLDTEKMKDCLQGWMEWISGVLGNSKAHTHTYRNEHKRSHRQVQKVSVEWSTITMVQL